MPRDKRQIRLDPMEWRDAMKKKPADTASAKPASAKHAPAKPAHGKKAKGA